ncbi:MAG: 2-aminoethylphosphonate--pyruvate transaminase [Ignavibacteria bacterium]|jgi:2-aminoethylphosphonate-pyruvate transaminase
MNNNLSNIKDKILFTPGPLTTSSTVKQAMLRDLGSRDIEFIKVVKEIRNNLLEIAGVSNDAAYEAVIMQGSGTFGIESVITSSVPRNGKLLSIINGAYGRRITSIAEKAGIKNSFIEFEENEIPVLLTIKEVLENDGEITNVSIVHCETTTGIINPLEEIGKIVKDYNKIFIVDAMSSFGAMEIDLNGCNVDYLVSSSNKCIEGVPGFSFVIVKKEELIKSENNARSLSLDLFEQWKGLEKNGQFRFTPPTHSILAFRRALKELQEEGGIKARAERYKKNNEILLKGMSELGFKTYLSEQNMGYIITSFLYPEDKNFSFEKFYELLNDKGQVIYPGKLSKVDCFRIGNIGRIFENDIYHLIDAVRKTLTEMNVNIKETLS